jgi:2-polyprenyl-3-methyl-5-hydroxy-6-metoxy-1,4-benzoquinol methylase
MRAWRALVRRLSRASDASEGAAPAVPSSCPVLPGESRPYESVLRHAADDGRVLHRPDIYGSGPPNQIANQAVLHILLNHAGASLLDVGCGIGTYTAAVAEQGIRTAGLEVNADYVARARALGRPVDCFDGLRIPYPDAAFECVAAIEVLEHVPDWDVLLREMVRVAARRVVISVPNIGVLPAMSRHLVGPWHLLEATHVNFFTSEILRRVLARDFPVLRHDVSEYGTFLINGEPFANHVLAVLHKPA